MAKGTFLRRELSIIPAGPTGVDALLSLPLDQPFIGEFRAARNPHQHDLYWALCGLVAKATEGDIHAVSDWLLTRTNNVRMLEYPDGTLHFDPKSVSWENMDQAEFRTFFDAAIPYISNVLEAAPEDIRRRFLDMMDDNMRAIWRSQYGRRRER